MEARRTRDNMASQVTVPERSGTRPSKAIAANWRALAAMTRSEIKLWMREPATVFFTLAFPVLLLLVFGSIFGNDPSAQLGGIGSVDISVPGYAAQVIATVAFFSLPVTIAGYRETGVLRRLRATPIQPWIIFAAQLGVTLISALVGVALLIFLGFVIYDLRLPVQPFGVFLALLLSIFAFAAAGFLIAALVSSARATNAVANALFFPQIFLSGSAFPRELMPDWLQTVSGFLPLTQVVLLLRGLWDGDGWDMSALLYVLAILIVGLIATNRVFRWE